jgi:hypothetical protein
MEPRTATAAPGTRLARATGGVVLALVLTIAGGRTVSAAGAITVRRATYGGNCGTSRDVARDDTARIAAECDAKPRCTYHIDRNQMSHRRDPEPHCAKSYVVVYACSGEKHHRVALQKPEANGHDIDLSCGD